MNFLTADHVLALHAALMSQFGGEEGVGHRGDVAGVNAVVGAVENAYYSDPFEFAAAYAVYIIQGHIFMDGNKRTGGACAIAFLTANHLAPRAGLQQIRDALLEMQRRAEYGERAPQLLQWFAAILRGRHVHFQASRGGGAKLVPHARRRRPR